MKNAVKDHNRTKNYILEEGEPVDFLVALGVQTADGKVVKAKYDKFRQINRYLEFVRDILPSIKDKEVIRIVDFGCGKSYLTFALYYYLKIKNNFSVDIIDCACITIFGYEFSINLIVSFISRSLIS